MTSHWCSAEAAPPPRWRKQRVRAAGRGTAAVPCARIQILPPVRRQRLKICRARGLGPTVHEFARMRRATRRRADLQSLEPNPIGPLKAPHKCPTATPTALHGPAALAGTRATAALASSRSETSRDGAAAAANDAVAKKHTHEARPPTSVLGREARASRTTDAGRRAPNVSRDRL